ncbi:MAG: hypothetical protein KGS09_08830 [Nitrospirae bacterium]|nr:hypothetical protein [Nitrospirota bacterium]
MPQISPRHTITQLPFPLITSPSLSPFTLFVILSIWPAVTPAEVRVVTAQGEHRMGNRDTREDAIRLATEAAKRNALEQVATYLESVTIVDGLDVTKDEIRTYTAGLVLVLEQDNTTALDGDTIIVRTDLVAQVDTEELGLAVAALRQNEDARPQLVALQQENDQLQQDLDAANQALAQASTAEQTQQAAQQRQDILNRVQSNAMVSQAWTDWILVSPVVYSYPWVGLSQTQALLNIARDLYPTSPHVLAAQQVITTRPPPPSPPQPSSPPAPRTAQQTMPNHQIVSQPGSRPAPLTLNEISHTTPTTPPQIGNQPPAGQWTPRTGSRNLTDIRQLNPLLPPSNGAPPNSRSARALQQFLQPPQTGQPPTINQIYQQIQPQAPRVPHQIAPRMQGGGGLNGGSHGEGHSEGGGHGGGRGGGR